MLYANIPGAGQNEATYPNVSCIPNPRYKDSLPPIEKPATAVFSRPKATEYLLSINGFKSTSKSFLK
ncbi:hypothetical protein D3C76_1568120 [compost metagenome]